MATTAALPALPCLLLRPCVHAPPHRYGLPPACRALPLPAVGIREPDSRSSLPVPIMPPRRQVHIAAHRGRVARGSLSFYPACVHGLSTASRGPSPPPSRPRDRRVAAHEARKSANPVERPLPAVDPLSTLCPPSITPPCAMRAALQPACRFNIEAAGRGEPRRSCRPPAGEPLGLVRGRSKQIHSRGGRPRQIWQACSIRYWPAWTAAQPSPLKLTRLCPLPTTRDAHHRESKASTLRALYPTVPYCTVLCALDPAARRLPSYFSCPGPESSHLGLWNTVIWETCVSKHSWKARGGSRCY